MPKDASIKKVLVIGSGPIVIGQAAEFDYAGVQACRALKDEGLEVVLVNSNPATIMTDSLMADEIYLEPLTLPTLKRIILKEKPDSLLSTLGGQTGLTLSMQLARDGFLSENGVKLLGARLDTIEKAEDRKLFKETMESIGQPCIPSVIAENTGEALAFAKTNGYPLIIRPAFTLGGSGGGTAHDEGELLEIVQGGLHASPIGQVLVERSVAGWKEIEFEVMRDSAGNVITVCSMENIDPVGIHTGDSIVAAPALTLSDREYQMLRSASLAIIDELKVVGGCNCQFALDPESFEYAVIEVNPRVSRSSALASKATGYPIAKVATRLALGYTLPEIKNAVTGTTSACFEPAIDYVVVKLPKWPFDKFVYARRTLGTQMQATGEVMAIGASFPMALMKAIRGAAIGRDTPGDEEFAALCDEDIRERLHVADDRRLFAVYEALKRGVSVEEVHAATLIDEYFLYEILRIADMELALARSLDDELYLRAKELGFTDGAIARISKAQVPAPRLPVYKMVDTCAAEFAASTPYFYSTFDEQNEAAEFIQRKSQKPSILVLGSGPIRIGQGIEFDYASVHCVLALKKLGFEVAIINNNPETVSTDFDTADRLYFEPITPEDVKGVIATEQPQAVVVAFGGQTAISLTKFLTREGIPILGTDADSIDCAEDRERFDAMLEELHIKRPRGETVFTAEQALAAARRIGYPVLLRPSYVLGGQNMIVAFGDGDVEEYMAIILSHNIENPVLIDQYLMGTELEVDAICDGEDVLIPGIMEHVERTGVHSGDSIAVYPPYNLDDDMAERIADHSKRIALALGTRGLINIQYLIYEGELYVIEANPRASRTVPYISKVTGVPVVEAATRAMLGEKLAAMGYGVGIYPPPPYAAVKVPVFSFEKLAGVDAHLGPEMKSTGEALGVAPNTAEALYKGLAAAGYKLNSNGGALFTVRKSDQNEIADTARRFYELGFSLYATHGTAGAIRAAGMEVTEVGKIHDSPGNNVLHLIENHTVDFVVSTSAKGRVPERASVQMRRKAVERSIPCLTSIDTANAVADSIKSRYSLFNTELVDINHMRKSRRRISFTKMQGTGNDSLYFDCREQDLPNPEALAVSLLDRHYGIGGEGVVLLYPSDKADIRMRMFNMDGTAGTMAGNSLRCAAKFAYDHAMASGRDVSIETDVGIKHVRLTLRNKEAVAGCVDMGRAAFAPEQIPALLDGDEIVDRPVQLGGRTWNITCVNMGNPHAVVFLEAINGLDLEAIGPLFENADIFPERVNTEFVQLISPVELRMRVYERGSGETWACGTGACAAVAAAVKNGFCKPDTDIAVRTRGGKLTIRCGEAGITLKGDVTSVFEGTVLV